MPEEYARVLAGMDTAIKNGSEDRINEVIRRVTGREPRRFADFVEANKEGWSLSLHQP